jgi:3-hydroxyisobutyrate dehydrogenase
MKVAMLGAGIMGAPMARNIASAGIEVVVWNRTRARAEAIDGVEVAGSPAAAAAGADFVITMLTDGSAVEAVAPDALREGITWLQMSTVGLEATERLAKLAADRGATYVDAPVLGTKEPAEKGALVVLAAGDADAIARARPIFDAVGSRLIQLGEVGEGQRLKLVANTWVVAITEATAETFAFAEALGVDPRKFLETIEGGPLDVGYARAKGELILKREFPPSFPLRLALKDARLVRDAARQAGVDVPLADVIVRQFERAVEDGHGDEDLAATYFATARDAGVT